MTGIAMSIRTTSGRSSRASATASSPFAGAADDGDPPVGREDRLERLGEETLVVGDQDTHLVRSHVRLRYSAWTRRPHARRSTTCSLTGDNRLKQGVSAEKIRQSYEQALAVAREAGLEESVRPLVEIRLADLERLAGGSPPPAPPAA